MVDHLIENLTNIAVEAAAIGARVHRAGWESGFRVEAKGHHGDSVTDVDVEAERAIRAFLGSVRPHDSIVGEEFDPPTRVGPVCWVVDPIDGTANYLRRSADFAVSVGVEVEGQPAIGVVQQTAVDKIWVGNEFGCRRNGESVGVARRSSLAETIWSTGFTTDPVDRRRQLDFFCELMTSVRDVRRSGSPALDLAHVADGTVDGHVEFGLGHWDYAAGVALVVSAGGTAEVIDVSPWRGPLVIAAGTRGLVTEMKGVLRLAGVPNS